MPRIKHPVMAALMEQMLLRCLVFLAVTTPVEVLSLVLLAKALEESPEVGIFSRLCFAEVIWPC